MNHVRDEVSALAHVQADLDRYACESPGARGATLGQGRERLATAKRRRSSADVWSRGLPRRLYTPLLLALTVAELPLLALAFQNFFSVGFSIIVSIGVSVAIIFCAHVAGILFYKRETVLLRRRRHILVRYLDGSRFDDRGSQHRPRALSRTQQPGSRLSTGPTWLVVIVFAIFNIMVFGAAVLVSKFRHSEYAEHVDDARRDMKTAQREIKRGRRREKKAREQLTRLEDRIVLLDGLADTTAQRARMSVDQAKLARGTAQGLHREVLRALCAREHSRTGRAGSTEGRATPAARVGTPAGVHTFASDQGSRRGVRAVSAQGRRRSQAAREALEPLRRLEGARCTTTASNVLMASRRSATSPRRMLSKLSIALVVAFVLTRVRVRRCGENGNVDVVLVDKSQSFCVHVENCPSTSLGAYRRQLKGLTTEVERFDSSYRCRTSSRVQAVANRDCTGV